MDEPKRLIGLTCTGAAIVLLTFALISNTWIHGVNGNLRAGVWKAESCWRECKAVSHRELQVDIHQVQFAGIGEPDYPAAFVPMAYVTGGLLVLAVAMLLVVLGLVLTKRRVLWPMQPTSIGLLALSVAVITGCVFVASKPGPAMLMGIGAGFIAFGVGAVAGLAGITLLAKTIIRDDDAWEV